MLHLKRAYDEEEPGCGRRILVDRLWPRGIKKEALELDDWVPDLAPSDDLRRWFNHDPEKWQSFRRKYFRELEDKRSHWLPLVKLSQQEDVTLVFGAKDRNHNNAVALKDFLARQQTLAPAKRARKRTASGR